MNFLFEFHFKAMGSPCQLQLYTSTQSVANKIKQRVVERIEMLENKYSRYRADSLLSQINQAAGSGIKTPIDSETVALLQYAEQCYQESEGLFDISSGVLRKMWDFTHHKIPNKQQLAACRQLVNWRDIEWDDKTLYLPKQGMELDFGGVVKEYATDTVAELCRQQGITAGLVELGGDICLIGPLPDKQGWPIAIQHPRQTDAILGKVSLTQGGLASSGDYQRYIEMDGQRYSHLLNPHTGYPVQGLQAVSVMADHCIIAGSIATIAMLKGTVGLTWLETLDISFMCCDHQGQLHSHLFFTDHP